MFFFVIGAIQIRDNDDDDDDAAAAQRSSTQTQNTAKLQTSVVTHPLARLLNETAEEWSSVTKSFLHLRPRRVGAACPARHRRHVGRNKTTRQKRCTLCMFFHARR